MSSSHGPDRPAPPSNQGQGPEQESEQDSFWPRYDNYNILKMTTIAFSLFVIFETAGGLLSNSISLLEDAVAMSLDVVTYMLNIYAEGLKLQNSELSEREALLVQTVIPLSSVIMLIALCAYFMKDAINVLRTDLPSEPDTVDVSYMYFFSILNGAIDVIAVWAFSSRGYRIFYDADTTREHAEVVSSLHQPGSPSRQGIDTGTRAASPSAKAVMKGANNPEEEESLSLLQLDNSPDEEESSLDAAENGETWAGAGGSMSATRLRLNSGDQGGNSSSAVIGALGQKNMVMITAASHVGGDTIRTISVLASAIYSSWSGTHADICDAWAAIIR
jgi:Co/Zn/Cd efflux system component